VSGRMTGNLLQMSVYVRRYAAVFERRRRNCELSIRRKVLVMYDSGTGKRGSSFMLRALTT
jgi:hypothetical protein